MTQPTLERLEAADVRHMVQPFVAEQHAYGPGHPHDVSHLHATDSETKLS